MRSRLSLSLLFGASTAIAACQSAPPGGAAKEIDASRDSIKSAVLRGDASAVAAHFAEAAVITPPDADEVVGRDAIRALFSGVFQQVRITQYDIRPDTILLAANGVAVERGTYVENVVPAQGPPTLLSGRYVFFWERGSANVWRASRLLYNHAPLKKP